VCSSDLGPTGIDGPIFGEAQRGRVRLKQGAFRVMVTAAYNRRCAVSGEKALPVLQAAHIKPVTDGGLHRMDNGLLLRSDVHTLFDRAYITVTPDHRVLVASRALKDDFDNGEPYAPFHGAKILLQSARPNGPCGSSSSGTTTCFADRGNDGSDRARF
jgi:putative restriction endonuclease